MNSEGDKMIFTDEDLKRLKEDLKYSGLNKSPYSSEHSIRNLIARLEAAENLASCADRKEFRSQYEQWKKVTGK